MSDPLRMALVYVCVDGNGIWAVVCDAESFDSQESNLGPSDFFWWVPGTWEPETADTGIYDGRSMLSMDGAGLIA